MKENEIKQSYPDLSFQLHEGSKDILKVDCIEEKTDETVEEEIKSEPEKE